MYTLHNYCLRLYYDSKKEAYQHFLARGSCCGYVFTYLVLSCDEYRRVSIFFRYIAHHYHLFADGQGVRTKQFKDLYSICALLKQGSCTTFAFWLWPFSSGFMIFAFWPWSFSSGLITFAFWLQSFSEGFIIFVFWLWPYMIFAFQMTFYFKRQKVIYICHPYSHC